jgi:hypothetical protein
MLVHISSLTVSALVSSSPRSGAFSPFALTTKVGPHFQFSPRPNIPCVAYVVSHRRVHVRWCASASIHFSVLSLPGMLDRSLNKQLSVYYACGCNLRLHAACACVPAACTNFCALCGQDDLSHDVDVRECSALCACAGRCLNRVSKQGLRHAVQLKQSPL